MLKKLRGKNDKFYDWFSLYEERKRGDFMNKYIVAVYHYFNGYQEFTIEAENKADAIENLKAKIKISGSGNYNINDIKVIKKLRKN